MTQDWDTGDSISILLLEEKYMSANNVKTIYLSLAIHCHSLGMVVIAMCHTSTSNAGADALEQLNDNDDNRIVVVRNWDVTAQGAAEVAKTEVFTT